MSWCQDMEFIRAKAEERDMKRKRELREATRKSRRDAEQAKRQALRDEIGRMVRL